MCYSVKTSIISYTLGMLSAVFALATRQWVLGMLILFYSQMQLSEALIWRGIDTGNVKLNEIGTKYGQYLLPTHNIGIGVGLLLSAYLGTRGITQRDWVPLLLGVLFFAGICVLYQVTGPSNPQTFPADKTCLHERKCQNNLNRLQWPFPHEWYIASFLLSLYFLFFWYDGTMASKLFLGIVFSGLFLGSGILAPKSVGSVWCFSTAVMAPILVLVNYALVRRNSA